MNAFRAFLCPSLLMSLLLGCAAASSAPADDEDPSIESDDALTGGTVATASSFPSTLMVSSTTSSCTGAKVGPRHILLAAHCLVDKHIAPGSMITVNNQPLPVWDRDISLEVEAAYVHPGWVDGGAHATSPAAPPDVAVIVIAKKSAAAFATVPSASVDMQPVAAGAALTLNGYGCESGLKGASTSARLKYAHTTAVGVKATQHAGSVVNNAAFAQALAWSYLFTPGKGLAAANASICPGDSGGPVYRKPAPKKPGSVIVGVNAYYSFADGGNLSTTNWHTRLDVTSHSDVGSWLASLGVQVKGAGVHTDRYRACQVEEGKSVCGVFAEAAAASGLSAPTHEARLENSGSAMVWAQRFGDLQLEVAADIIAPQASDVVVRNLKPADDDPCKFAHNGDKAYCGDVLVGADKKTVYACEAGRTVSTVVCAKGCDWKGACVK